MSTVTPRRAETLEESSERRVLFCLWVVRVCGFGKPESMSRVGMDVLLAVVSCGHGGLADMSKRL